MQEEKFMKKSAEEMHVQLSDGRIIPLENKDDKSITSKTSKLKVGEWFRIDRRVIKKNSELIRRKCNEAGRAGKALWERFKESNEIADENPDQYPHLIETYIFKHFGEYETEQKMREICEEVGEGMCCEVICDLELQMRICNGELVDDLLKKPDKLECVRVIKFRNGETGYFGGGADHNLHNPPAVLNRYNFEHEPNFMRYNCTPYAFRFCN